MSRWIWGLIGVGVIAAVASSKRSKRTRWPLSDFDSPDLPGSGQQISKDLLDKLATAEDIIQSYKPSFQFKFNSGVRTQEYNDNLSGSVKNSPHVKGYAVDIHAPDNMKKLIVYALNKAGFVRIGIGRTFVHADVAPDLWPQVSWGYPTPGTPPPFNPKYVTLEEAISPLGLDRAQIT